MAAAVAAARKLRRKQISALSGTLTYVAHGSNHCLTIYFSF